MDESETRFARRLGLALGVWDWWTLKDRHTPYEWALQLLADGIEPIGEARADMRAARNTTAIIGALIPSLTDEELNSTAASLQNYLQVNQPEDRTLLPEEAEALKRKDS